MTSHHYTESATPDATKRYPSDLNDQEVEKFYTHGLKYHSAQYRT